MLVDFKHLTYSNYKSQEASEVTRCFTAHMLCQRAIIH
jgi:hypothetical protein